MSFSNGGGVSICGLDSYAQSPSAVGVPDDAYIFSVSGPGINPGASGVGIYYSTSTQQNLNAPKIWDAAANKFYYYVPASESPVSFYLATYTTTAFTSIVNQTKGTNLSYAPQSASIRKSAVSPGDVVEVNWDMVDNVKSGTLTFTCDDPSKIRLLNYVGGYYYKYSADEFNGNTLTIKYDPKTELNWTVATVGNGTPFKATLNNTPLERKTGMVFNTGNTYDYTTYYTVSLPKGSSDNNVVVTTQWPEFEMPVSIKVVQNGGNETVDAKLQEKITSVRVDGTVLDRSAWEGGKSFNVKNGATVSYYLATQVSGRFEVKSRTLNGTSIGTSANVMIEGDVASPQEIILSALVNNTPRITIVSDAYNHFEVTSDGYYYPLSGPSTLISKNGYSTEFPLTFSPGYGFEITQVKSGEKIYKAVNGEVTLDHKGMDATYEVTCVPYERTQDLTVTVGSAAGGSLALILSPKNPANREWVYLDFGKNTIKVHPNDFPVSLASSAGCVYVNGEKVEPDAEGYYFAEKPAAGQDIRLFDNQINPVSVKVTNQSGKNCTITIDGKTITSGIPVDVLPGSQVVITPTTSSDAANLMLQTGSNNNSYILQTGNKFTYTVKGACDLTLRPKAIVTVALDSNWKQFQIQETTTGQIYSPNSQTYTMMLPYVSGASTTTAYTLKVYDPSKIYTISTASASGVTAGFSYSVANETVTFRSGATVNITTKKNPKPYYVNIHVAPNDNYYSYNPKSGLYEDNYGGVCDQATNLICVKNGESYGGGSMGGGSMPYKIKSLLRIGDNNYYRDYSSDASNFNNTSSPDFQETFNLDESEFPLTIFNASSLPCQYSSVVVAEKSDYGYYFNYIGNDEEYTINKPADGSYTLDLYISYDSNVQYRNETINFNPGGAPYYYEVDGTEPVLVEPENHWSDLSAMIYQCSSVKIYPAEKGFSIKSLTVNITNTDPIQIEPNEKGEYIINGRDLKIWNNYGYNTTCKIDVDFDGCYFTFSGGKIGDMDGPTAIINGRSAAYEALVSDPEDVTIKLGFYSQTNVDPSYVIKTVTDKNSGKVLGYDHRTGKLTGLEAGMDLNIEYENVVTDRTMTVKFQGSKASGNNVKFNSTNAMLELGNGATQGVYYANVNASTFTSVNVKFSSLYDLPFKLKDVEYTNNGTTMMPDVFLNNEKIEYVNGAYAFPYDDVPDKSTLVIVRKATNQTSSVNVSTQTGASGDSNTYLNLALEVNGTVVSENIADDAFNKPYPVSSVVKVVNKGSATDYTVRYSTTTGGTASEFKAVPAAGVTLSLGVTDILFDIQPVMNNLTFSPASGTDLATITVTDENGKKFDLTDGSISLPTSVKSLKVTTSEPESYLTVSSSADGMTFDKDSGVLSGLATATVTLTTNRVVRESEVKIFVDDEDLPGTIVLGNGKVIETSESLTEGFQTVKFSDEDLPLIYRLAEVTSGDGEDEGSLGEDSGFDPARPETMPAVYVNGQRLEYSEEHGGYIFPVEALTGDTAPVIKIYAPDPTATGTTDPDDPDAPEVGGVKNITLFYLVEPGITFKAIEDYSAEVTEAGMREVLPSTYIELEAKTDNGEPLFVEVDGERVEATDGKYLIQTGNSDVTIAVKVEKLNVTVVSEDAWQAVRVTGNGFSYPMYDATSELQFPASTKSLQLFTELDGYVITNVIDDAGQAQFNAVTGELTNIKSESKLTLVMGEYNRDVELLVYVEDLVENNQISHVVLSEGKSVVKNVALTPGYQTVMIHKADLPLAVTTSAKEKAKVYVNNELLEEVDGKYQFPEDLPAKSIVKIYSDEQYKISVEYTVDLRGYNFKVWHDRQQDVAINPNDIHEVLPGTEISFTLTPQAAQQTFAFNAIRTMADDEETGEENDADSPVVTINDENVSPDENGVYTLKVNDSHLNGISIKAISPEPTIPDIPTGVEAILADGETANVYDLNGTRILKNATTGDLKKLPAGVYIINGEKHLIK
ncbi:MAG: hypothetical protein K2M07_06390 [Muribaculaceae bacterium]|nr:hypothetical protein [Muribaculaceae bacterium]